MAYTLHLNSRVKNKVKQHFITVREYKPSGSDAGKVIEMDEFKGNFKTKAFAKRHAILTADALNSKHKTVQYITRTLY